jgi:hypothetical protein
MNRRYNEENISRLNSKKGLNETASSILKASMLSNPDQKRYYKANKLIEIENFKK